MLIPCTAYALQAKDLLSLIAMPLAVAAVSDVAGVPQQDLADFAAALNEANVPPQQFVEVVRYAPIALTNDATAPQFVQFVTSEVDRGTTSDSLVQAIAERLRSYGATEIDVVAPRYEPITIAQQPVVIQQQRFVEQRPVVVQEPLAVRQPAPARRHHAVAEREIRTEHRHPHGGPPGQLKKIIGVQTGAEIVHGNGRGEGGGHGHGNGNGHGNGHGKGKHE